MESKFVILKRSQRKCDLDYLKMIALNIDTCQENSRDFLSLGSKDTKWGCTFFFFFSYSLFNSHNYLSQYVQENIISLTRIAIKFLRLQLLQADLRYENCRCNCSLIVNNEVNS